MTDISQLAETESSRAISDSIDEFQAIVDTAQAKTTALVAQRDALKAQAAGLSSQISAINVQIAALEGPDAKKARTVIRVLQQINSGKQLRSGRF